MPLLEERCVGWAVLLGVDVTTPDALAGAVLEFDSLLRLLGG